MAGVAIVGNGTSVGARMASVVTAEASGKVHVPEIVGIRAPSHIHRGEHVPQIHGLHLIDRRLHQPVLQAVHVGIRRLIEAVQARRDLPYRGVAVRIFRIEQRGRLFLDKRQFRTDAPLRHRVVQSPLRQLECVRGPVVAVDAIHSPVFARCQLLGRGFRIRRSEHGLLACFVRIGDLSDRLPLPVRGDVFDRRIHIQVAAVDSHSAVKRVAADFQHQHGSQLGVLFVIRKFALHVEFIAGVDLRRNGTARRYRATAADAARESVSGGRTCERPPRTPGAVPTAWNARTSLRLGQCGIARTRRAGAVKVRYAVNSGCITVWHVCPQNFAESMYSTPR